VPPGRLVIGIREREPVALDAHTREGVDAAGARFALSAEEQAGLPRVSGDLPRALQVVEAARQLQIGLESVDAQAQGSAVQPAGEPVTLWLADRPYRDLQGWLALRASGLLARHRAREIDLRFEGSAVLRQIETETEEGDIHGSQR
jgi:hypothetical protein